MKRRFLGALFLFCIATAAQAVSGDFTLNRPITVDGIWPEKLQDGTSAQVVAVFPDGRMEPLIWFYEYRNAYRHPFFLRESLVSFSFRESLHVMLIGNNIARTQHVRTGRNLELLTIGWNSLEAVIAIASGLVAGSIALVGFGFDSVIELSSGVTLLWRLSLDSDAHRRERIEAATLKIVGVTFLVLAAYVAYEAAMSLWLQQPPEASYVGIGLAALSLIVMPALARAKRRVAAQIQSRALQADSRQTDICAYLSAILLGGLVLNALVGFWWADPVAALIMVPIIAKEGIEALKGETCCDSCD